MRFRRINMALGLAAAVAFATPALAGTHNTSSKSNKFLSTFVRAYAQCTGSTHNHNPPLAFFGCTPATATPAISFGIKGFGQAKGVVLVNSLKKATDVSLISKFIDIRNGDDGTGSGFDGFLGTTTQIRTTDDYCDGAANNVCTTVDIPFPVGVPCGSNVIPPLPAGKCLAKTSANAVVPGSVSPGHAANVELQQLQVYSGPNLAFSEGLLLP